MDLKDEFVIKDVGKLTCFNGSTSKPYGRVMLDIALHNKVVLLDFYLINFNTLHNGLLGQD